MMSLSSEERIKELQHILDSADELRIEALPDGSIQITVTSKKFSLEEALGEIQVGVSDTILSGDSVG